MSIETKCYSEAVHHLLLYFFLEIFYLQCYSSVEKISLTKPSSPSRGWAQKGQMAWKASHPWGMGNCCQNLHQKKKKKHHFAINSPSWTGYTDVICEKLKAPKHLLTSLTPLIKISTLYPSVIHFSEFQLWEFGGQSSKSPLANVCLSSHLFPALEYNGIARGKSFWLLFEG